MKQDEVYLKHILGETIFILDYAKELSYESFLENELYTRAFTRSIEIIGEAVKNLSPEFRNSHPDIEWRKIAGMRDKLIHAYFSVDYEILWDVVVNKLPEIKNKLSAILDKGAG